jgi:hypothetical protein
VTLATTDDRGRGRGAPSPRRCLATSRDALSQFDTQYALIELADVKMRYLDRLRIARFPGNGFLALGMASGGDLG